MWSIVAQEHQDHRQASAALQLSVVRVLEQRSSRPAEGRQPNMYGICTYMQIRWWK